MGELVPVFDEDLLAKIVIRLNERIILLEKCGQHSEAVPLRRRSKIAMDRLELERAWRKRHEKNKGR